MIYFIIGFLGGILSSIVCLLGFSFIRYLRMRRIEEKAYEELNNILPLSSGATFGSVNRIYTASEIDNFRISNYAKVFEDAQRSHNKEIVDLVYGEARSGREVRLDNEAFDSDQGIKVVPGKRHCLIVYIDVDGLFRSKLIEFDFFTHDGLNVQFFCDGDLVYSCGYMKLESILFC